MPETLSISSPSAPAMTVSIVIVNYNVKDFLYQCLQSIERVRHRYSLQVLVVDNNSRDGSVEFLQPLFPWVEFISLKENIGFGRANNVGIEKAFGNYVLLLNPDTILEEDTIAAMSSYMDEHPQTGIAGCKVLNADGTFQVQCRRGFPTPWASFCKLFGLQALFPRSPLFARYNQTFRSEDETYNVDAVIGAFMFCRADALRAIGGFDPDFFMYGEDLDLCYRMAQQGYSTAYVPTTTIIHFKGESTRRSSMNEVKVFYQAMEIFARKHYGTSKLFLAFLQIGIWLRSQIAYLIRYRRGIAVMLTDLLCVNLMLMLATSIRFGSPFDFPAYAYPTVFIVLTVVVATAMIFAGEYFEYAPTIRRAFIGYLISFFMLSSLTYYWNQYAFSRGVVLTTIGLAIVCALIIRSLLALFDKLYGEQSDRRIALLGINEKTEQMITALHSGEALRAHVIGIIATRSYPDTQFMGLPVLGNVDYIAKLLEEYAIQEVIILDEELSHSQMMDILRSSSALGVRYHIAKEYETVVISRIINDVAGVASTLPQYRILAFRNKLLKRLSDILGAFVALSIGTPVVFLTGKGGMRHIQTWWEVLAGRQSIVGAFPLEGDTERMCKVGITGLARISQPERLSPEAIKKLNEYYAANYSPVLDADIIFKHLFRKRK